MFMKILKILSKILTILITILAVLSTASFATQVQSTDGSGAATQSSVSEEQRYRTGTSNPNVKGAGETGSSSGTQEGSGDTSGSTIISEGKGFIEKGKSEEKISWDAITKSILPIANVLVAIATVVFVVVGMIMGVKYMISGADEKAGLKQKLIWLIIAMILVYGAVGIYNVVVNVMLKITE